MPHLGITHLSFRQPDMQLGGVNQPMRIGCKEMIPRWRMRLGDGIILGFIAVPQPSRMASTTGFGLVIYDL